MTAAAPAPDHPRLDRPVPAWGLVGLLAQVAFTLGWILPETWQRPGYHWLASTISDMQAATAPHAWVPIACFALGGAGTFAFVAFGLRPGLRSAGGAAAYAPWAIAVAALALGNSFPLIPCQVGPGCTAAQQLATAGGATDAVVSGLALLVVAFSPGFLWLRLARVAGWSGFRPVAQGARAACAAAWIILCAASLAGRDQGLAERILVTACTLWLAALSAGFLLTARRAAQ